MEQNTMYIKQKIDTKIQEYLKYPEIGANSSDENYKK